MTINHLGSTLEGDPYEFRVNLFSTATTAVTVDVITIANTADASDYTPLTTTVTIPAGELSSEVLYIPTTNDAAIEPMKIYNKRDGDLRKHFECNARSTCLDT